MLTEASKKQLKIDEISNGIRLCEEAISKAETYERLNDNPDWKAYLSDLETVVSLHDREIQFGLLMLMEAPPNTYVKHDARGEVVVSSSEEWIGFIKRHQIQREELKNWTKEPARILMLASQARIKLPELKAQLLAMTEGGNNVDHVVP